MRNKFLMVMTVWCTAFVGDYAMAIEMEDLEVTIRVIESNKEDRDDLSHKLELPDFSNTKPEMAESVDHGKSGEHSRSEKRGELETSRQGREGHEHGHVNRDAQDEVKQDFDDAKKLQDESKQDLEDHKESRDDIREEQEESKADYEEAKEEYENATDGLEEIKDDSEEMRGDHEDSKDD